MRTKRINFIDAYVRTNGVFQPLQENCKYGAQGQLLTFDHEELRDYCLKQPATRKRRLKAFVQALLDIKQAHPRVTVNRERSSYNLKHLVERIGYGRPMPCEYEYISNEELIVALVQAGFNSVNCARRGCHPSPNYWFNIPAWALVQDSSSFTRVQHSAADLLTNPTSVTAPHYRVLASLDAPAVAHAHSERCLAAYASTGSITPE